MPANQNLYFLAIIPPQFICNEIHAFKTDIATRFHSKHALKTIPHITLKAPFKLLSTYHNSLLSWFHQLSLPQLPFQQTLDGFGAFHNPKYPVLFVKPVVSQNLISLQAELLSSFQTEFPFLPVSGLEKDYHPHITIAHRDFPAACFGEAWAEYGRKGYKTSFTVTQIHVLQYLDKGWQVIATTGI